jgi:hypothetical protein
MVKEYVDRYYPALREGTAGARARGTGAMPVPTIAADERSLPVDDEA